MKIVNPEISHVHQLRKLWQEAFSDTEGFIEQFFLTAFSKERCRCAIVDDHIAAALYWFTCSYHERRVAYLYAVATDFAFRGRGICHRLMEDTHIHLKKLGYDAVILVPGSESLFHFYERMGYRLCSSIREIHCAASDEEIMTERISKQEYANKRRVFLPENGIVQEQENLDFLGRVENLYAGEGFLLAGHREEETFIGVELLGDLSAAPKILKRLGCRNGTFRTIGEGKPFAMCYPLSETIDVSDVYFGIAFDL